MHERGIVRPRNEFLDSALAQIRRDSFPRPAAAISKRALSKAPESAP
jgi:hypothetical protein